MPAYKITANTTGIMEAVMFAFTLVLILFLPITVLPLVLETFFSPYELSATGVCLGDLHALQEDGPAIIAPGSSRTCNCENADHSRGISEQRWMDIQTCP